MAATTPAERLALARALAREAGDDAATLNPRTYAAVCAMFQQASGIQLGPAKVALVSGRLSKLAQAAGCDDVNRYVEEVLRGGESAELVRVIDKLTTNETYFFREPDHFDLLASLAQRHRRGETFRVWSAASSSGEEAHSIAMVLADKLGAGGWEIVGTDLSTAMVEAARRGLYPLERARGMPDAYLKRYCRRGQGPYEGQLLVARELRERIRFLQANLTQALPELGAFDVIFLRNVLIYFDAPGKVDIVLRVIERLKPGALLFTGHAESLNNMGLPVRSVHPAVYARA